MIALCEPCLDGNARQYLNDCLDSTFVSSVGAFVDRFEKEFAVAVGSPHAIACASGTAAIHLALIACGVGPGDLVLTSDFTFIATANPIRYQQAQAAFIDSEAVSWNLDPKLLVQALEDLAREGRLPKAVLAVHILGQPADLGPIVAACERHGVALIEDAAEALGAGYTVDYPFASCAGKQVGTIGRIGCFSFNGNKIITTGGGGMMTTADPVVAKKLKHLSTQAKLPGLAFVHDEVGYNYRLTNLAASLGVAQLERLPEFIVRKQRIARRYRELSSKKGWEYHPILPGTAPTCWLASVLVGSRRDAILDTLTKAGIGARPLWMPVAHQVKFQGSRRWGGAVAERLAAEGLSLPCSAGLTEAQLDQVITALESC